MSTNPISAYMTAHDVGTVEMARLLGVSKGYASRLKDGGKPITPRVAKQLSRLTGKPWWEYVPEDDRCVGAPQTHGASA